ncbi:MAG: hemolysin family protein [Gammaproteobacteria bacterium]|jgi:CBS domain containing-hemolysin-like protein|nr:hemolysin family protein [Gammaproteobacteria bacterium]
MTTAIILLLTMPLLLLLQGFFSGAEIAIVNCDRAKLRHRAKQGDAGAQLALRLLEQPEVVLSTTLVGTNVALVSLTSLATAGIIGLVGHEGDILAVFLLVPVTLILGEIVPKSVFQQRADELTPRIIYPLYACSLLLFPVIFFFSRTARLVARMVGPGSKGNDLFVVREQVRAILDTAEGGATIDIFDAARIRNVVRFGECVAGDVMVPAAEMTVVNVDASMDEVARLLRDTEKNQIAVYSSQRTEVIGIVSATIWDTLAPGFKARELRDLIKPAYFVPVQQPLVDLLPVLRTRADQTAVVVDEYGSAVGLITVDDIVATVVGRAESGVGPEPADAAPAPRWEALDDGAFVMEARLTIAEVNDVLGTRIRGSEARTIGGLVLARLRHVPGPGEAITEAGYRFTVIEATERTVAKLRVTEADSASDS